MVAFFLYLKLLPIPAQYIDTCNKTAPQTHTHTKKNAVVICAVCVCVKTSSLKEQRQKDRTLYVAAAWPSLADESIKKEYIHWPWPCSIIKFCF